MMKPVFELVHVDNNQVVLKVVAEDNLAIAMHPYISGDFDYITVTRGRQHILTIVYKTGKTFSFNWGDLGHTLVSRSLDTLRAEVCKFIESKGILIDLTTYDVTAAYIWQRECWYLNVDGAIYRSSTAKTLEDMQKEVKRFLNIKGWGTGHMSPGGCTVWNVEGPIVLTEVEKPASRKVKTSKSKK